MQKRLSSVVIAIALTMVGCAGSGKPVSPTGPSAPGVDLSSALAVVVAAAEAAIPLLLESSGAIDADTAKKLGPFVAGAGMAMQAVVAELQTSDSRTDKIAKINAAFVPIMAGVTGTLTPQARAIIASIQAAAAAVLTAVSSLPALNANVQQLAPLAKRAAAVQVRVSSIKK